MARPPASAEARELRITQLLDAAVMLWLAHPERIPSVAEVAAAAGVAKGTVYLYFKCKEDLLLAVHERNVAAFFDAFIARAQSTEPWDFDGVLHVTCKHIVDVPGLLPLATLVAALLHKGATPEYVQQFEERMAERMRIAGTLLHARFDLPDELAGVRFLMRGYALVLGLWQLVGGERPACATLEIITMLRPDYASELEAALRALWHGTLNGDTHA